MFADGSPSRTKLLISCCTGTALVVRFTDDETYRSGLFTQEEVAANSLAADNLMPRPLLAEHIKKWGTDVCALARFFKVSEAAMRIRLGFKWTKVHSRIRFP